MKRLKKRHWAGIALLVVVLLPSLWFALAYAGLPRLWSHHEHRKMGGRTQIVSYTAQDIPADPINLRLKGSAAQIDCAMQQAGWTRADAVSVRSGLKIGVSVLFGRAYPAAPVSPLYVKDQAQDFAYQRDEGKSADRRHHVRFWRVGDDDWLAAATFDRGVGFSLFTGQVTHHIGPHVDYDRDMIGAILATGGARAAGTMQSQIAGDRWHRNGGGDRYRTDGIIKVFALGNCPHG